VLRHTSDCTLSQTVRCARSPAAGLTQVELPLKANLADILLDLGRKRKLSKSPDIRFRNRTTDDLPTEIQGKAYWLESRTEGRSAYHLREGLYTYPVEYINGTWYRISWTIDECYEVSREDEIIDPQEKGLGVTAAYATITSRLGVIVTRLLAAAFWLVVENLMLLPS
jgi:hypothetical protein